MISKKFARLNRQFIFCRPQGGLTDIFSRIGACCRYANAHGRMVIVETNFPVSAYFRDAFSRYFISHDHALILSGYAYSSKFQNMDVEPAAFTGRLNAYQVYYDNKVSALAEVGSAIVPYFDFTKKYKVPLLLYQAVGGGLRKAEIAVRRLSITPMVLKVLSERLARMGNFYTSIHIRHTDYSTDYQRRVEELRLYRCGVPRGMRGI